MEHFHSVLGAQLRSFRILKGLNIEELSHKAGMSPSHLGKIERGERNFTVNSLDKIVKALDISYSQLFGFESESHTCPPPNPLVEKTMAYLSVMTIDEQRHIYKTVRMLSDKK